MTTQPKDKPTDPHAEWVTHWPFKRASPELIRRVQAAQRQKKVPEGESAPF